MKKILIVGAGQEQAIAIGMAKELGFFVIACDQNPEAPGLAMADESAILDIKNVSSLLEIATKYKVDGIFTHAVEIPHIISQVAKKIHLPSLSPEVALRATNKLDRIKRLKECGIPCANFAFASDKDQLLLEAKKIGYPLIIKPIDSAGARGVQEVDSDEKLLLSYMEAIQFSDTKTVLLEEKMSGPEISTESLVYNGEIHTFAFADRNYLKKDIFYPFFVEDGINYPSTLSDKTKKDVYELVAQTIKALEIDFGAAKGDIIIDRGTPKIIEMAARTSGGWFSAGSIRIATGANVLKPLLQMAVGLNPDLSEVMAKYDLGCAQRYVIPVEEGVVTQISGLEEAIKVPGVEMYNFFMPKIGARVKKSTNHSERFGQIICTGATREEAIQRCEEAISKIKVTIEPRD